MRRCLTVVRRWGTAPAPSCEGGRRGRGRDSGKIPSLSRFLSLSLSASSKAVELFQRRRALKKTSRRGQNKGMDLLKPP